MRYKTTIESQWGPTQTPKPILYLILTTAIASIFSTLTEGFVTKLFGMIGPERWLGLSLYGIKHFFLWQPLTYMFVQDSGQGTIGGGYLLTLFFNLYIIWVMGSLIFEQFGAKSFFKLYFASGILAGLAGVIAMAISGQDWLLTGPTPSILALLVVWTMIYPEVELLFFFVLPIKAKWLTTGIIGAILLSTLSQFNFVTLIFYLAGVIVGYLYGVMVYGLHAPFSFMEPFERWVNSFVTSKESKGNIVDFKTGKEYQSDEAFIDEMLTKISQKGETALTYSERKRLDEISKKRFQ